MSPLTSVEERLLREASDRFLATSRLPRGAIVRLGIEGRHQLRYLCPQRTGTVRRHDGTDVYLRWNYSLAGLCLIRRDFLEPVA